MKINSVDRPRNNDESDGTATTKLVQVRSRAQVSRIGHHRVFTTYPRIGGVRYTEWLQSLTPSKYLIMNDYMRFFV
jgi:hypothetical protein